MTDLRSRLARLGYRAASDLPSEVDAAEDEPPQAPSPRRRGDHSIDRVIPGSYLPTPQGDCFVVEHPHSLAHPHGSHRLEEALEVDPQLFGWMGRDPNLAAMDLSSSVFLDLETTGLAGGTGTYAFLVGIGCFEGTRFVVRQYFMEDYDGEEALLHSLEEMLLPYEQVVTFNGKVFDLPLLETRFQMARRRFPLRGALHLDLLFPARRLWRDRLDSCALSSLEEAVLGVERERDVPGWAIPGIYFEYLRSGDARPLAPVFRHNLLDLLSLVVLAARLARQYEDPFHASVENAYDLSALGGVFEGLGLADRAALCYERSLALAPSGELGERTLWRLGNLYKRLRQRQDAEAVWRRLAESGRAYTTFAYVELAKHFEHVAREYGEAERITMRALTALELRAAREPSWRIEQERRELEHRLARLRRKTRTE